LVEGLLVLIVGIGVDAMVGATGTIVAEGVAEKDSGEVELVGITTVKFL
jgi:hypothetical protein